MKFSITAVLLFFFLSVFGQEKKQLSGIIKIQPELTTCQTDFSNLHSSSKTASKFSIGITASLQFGVTEHFFIHIGLGYVGRDLKTETTLERQLLPHPYTDTSGLGIYSKSVSNRLIQIPVGFGFNITSTAKGNLFVRADLSPNFVVDTKYKLGIKKYPGFKKATWFGLSFCPTIGFDRVLTKKIKLTNSISYSIYNRMEQDKYLDPRYKLSHSYLQWSVGLRWRLR